MIPTIKSIPTNTFDELKDIKYEDLYYIGDLSLLKKKKVAIKWSHKRNNCRTLETMENG